MPEFNLQGEPRATVLAVDPGGNTGYATWNPAGDDETVTGQMEFEPFVNYVAIFKDEFSAIVCESYTITQETMRKSRQNWSLELIGFLRATAMLEGIPFVIQSPGDAKRFGTDEKLAKAGWLVTPKYPNRHANDALRHLMLYCVKNRLMEVPR